MYTLVLFYVFNAGLNEDRHWAMVFDKRGQPVVWFKYHHTATQFGGVLWVYIDREGDPEQFRHITAELVYDSYKNDEGGSMDIYKATISHTELKRMRGIKHEVTKMWMEPDNDTFLKEYWIEA